MEETSEELPNFSISIDLLRPDPTSSKNIESRIKKNRKLRVSQICRKTSCSKFWARDILWEQKRHQLVINKKFKIFVFIVVFKFVMHFSYRRIIRLYLENFSYLAITRQITQEDINLLLIKTTAARSSQVAVMTSHCS